MSTRKTVLVTGANTGIGASCALQLAAPGTRLLIACRSRVKAEPVLEAARARGADARFVRLDLASIAQATEAAKSVAREHCSLDVLVDNAGVAGQRGLTADGFELAFGVNHLGHFAFTLPLMASVAKARGRVVVVSSRNHEHAREIPWAHLRRPTRSVTGLAEYGVSKLCNVLFAGELRRRWQGVEVVAMHPGRIESDIFRRIPAPLFPLFKRLFPMDAVDVGGARLVHAATAPLEPGAVYFDRDTPKAPSPVALSADLAAELWDYSARAVERVTGAPIPAPRAAAEEAASDGASA